MANWTDPPVLERRRDVVSQIYSKSEDIEVKVEKRNVTLPKAIEALPALPISTIPYETVWEPIPNSSQEFAIDTRAHHTLYTGPRGPGKTCTQLMRFRKFVGIGYGSYWRGVIFDREFKHLGDLVAQGNRFFPQFQDGVQWLKSATDYKWVWPTGEELLLRHVKHLEDYNAYHGHEYCLEVNEKVITTRGEISIGQISVGDFVLTPKGYRRITAVLSRRYRSCVKTSFFDKDYRLISSQVTSEDHRTLTSDGWQLLGSEHSFSNILLLKSKIQNLQSSELFHSCLHPNNSGYGDKRECVDNFAKVFDTKLENALQVVSCSSFLQLLQVVFHQCGKNQLSANLFRKFYKFFSLSHLSMVKTKLLLSDRQPQFESSLSILRYLFLNCYALFEDVLFLLQKVQDFLIDCFDDFCRYDELLRTDIKIDRLLVRLLLDAQGTFLEMPSGDSVTKVERSRHDQRTYSHPYTGKRQYTNLQFSEVFSRSEPFGMAETVDIEVEDANCYISSAGVVNQNCFIGWNELTKQPTSELYDKMMSVNRSSFSPEKHTPKKRVGNSLAYNTIDGKPLPPIPLEVFSTTNPYGPGHSWVKKRFIDVAKYGQIVRQNIVYFDELKKENVSVERTQVTIFGSFFENIYLDPVYRAGLIEACQKDPHLEAAWIRGDWSVSSGGAVDDLWDTHVHLIDRFKIPSNWKVDRTFDWGSSAPFAVVWWAEANGEEVILEDGDKWCPPKGTLIAIAENYGTEKIGTNKGLKLSADEVCDRIIEEEKILKTCNWISSKVQSGPADNQIRDVREADVDTIETKMACRGVRWTQSDKSKGSRVIGLQLFRERLRASKIQEGPGIYFMRNCKACIEILPDLPRDPDKPEDIDSDCEDHIWDAVRYRVLLGSNKWITKLKTSWPR